MNEVNKDRVIKVFFLSFIFGSIIYTRPGLGIDNLSYGNGFFYFYIFAFVYLLVKWLR